MNGSNAEIEQAVDRCERLIRAFLARHPGGPAGTDLEDCLQEARIRLWKVLRDGRDIEFLAAYIRKIVDSVVQNRMEKVVRERNLLSSARERLLADASAQRPRKNGNVRDLIEDVRLALGSLMDSRRMVLEMTMAGLSLGEIAAERKWSRKKTYTLYERGIQDLRKVFKERGRNS